MTLLISPTTLTLNGPNEDLQDFLQFAKNGEAPLSINNFVPMPEEVQNTSCPNPEPELAARLVQEHGAPDWYE